jgi:hypothetical protein
MRTSPLQKSRAEIAAGGCSGGPDWSGQAVPAADSGCSGGVPAADSGCSGGIPAADSTTAGDEDIADTEEKMLA